VTAIDILSALMLSICGTKGPVMTAKQTPWMCPCLYHNIMTLDTLLANLYHTDQSVKGKQKQKSH